MRRSAGSRASEPRGRYGRRTEAVQGGFVRRVVASIICTLCVLPLAGALAIAAPVWTPSAQATGTGTCTVGSQSSSFATDSCSMDSETANSYTVTINHTMPDPLCTNSTQINCVVAEEIGNGSADPKTINCPFYSGTVPKEVLAADIPSNQFSCTITGPTSEFGPEEIFGEDVRVLLNGSCCITDVDQFETVFLFNPTGTSSVVNPTASFTTTQSTTNPLTWNVDASNSSPSSGQTITNYAWNFGDGSTGSGKTTSHTYAADGTYTVGLTVTDNDGGTATTTHLVHTGVLTVNSTGDLPEVSPADGACDTGGTVGMAPECTLRAAIAIADGDGGGDTIKFDIPGGATPVLAPATPYPPITAAVTIDGTSQSSGWVEIDGTNTATTSSILEVSGGGTTVQGLSIVNYAKSAILLSGAGGDTITGDLIGVDPTNTVGLVSYGVEIGGSPSATITHDTIDAKFTGIAAVAAGGQGLANLTVAHDDIGVTPDGTALAQPGTVGTAGVIVFSATAASPGVTVSNNVIAGYDNEILGGGSALPGLGITGNQIGLGTGGIVLPSTATGFPTYGVRVDGAPSPGVSNNDIAGSRFDVALSGAVDFGETLNDDGSQSVTVLAPGDPDLITSPVTGNAATVSNNLVGVTGDGSTTVIPLNSPNGIVLFTGEANATITGNTVTGHQSEISITGGTGDTIAGNLVGEGQHGEAEATPDQSGITLSGVANSVIGGQAGNDIGDSGGTGLSLTDVTGTTVSNNLVGLAPDGHSSRANQIGIAVSGASTGTQIGPGNDVSGNATWGIESGSPSLTIAGNDIGTDATGTTAVSNGTGVIVTSAATDNTLSSNVIGGTPSAGVLNIPAAGITNAEVGIDVQATGAKVNSNHIGVALGGSTPLGNTDGIVVEGGGPTATISANVIADNGTGILSYGSSVIRSNPMYGNGAGIGGTGLSPTMLLGAADRVTTGGVTRTWLAVGGLPASGDGTIEAFGNPSCSDPEGKVPLKVQTPMLGQSAQVVTIIGNETLQGFTVTYTPAGGATSAFSQCVTATTTAPDQNGDGIPDAIEALGPYGSQGAADPMEAAVPTDNGSWIGLQLHAADGAQLSSVAPLADPGTEPSGVTFPNGLVTFSITGLQPGARATVQEITTNPGVAPTAYWKFGPNAPGGAPTWYQWDLATSGTGTGATPEVITVNGTPYSGFDLEFTDGALGDDDLAANGTVTDPGGPAFDTNVPGGDGYVEAAADGGVFALGDAAFEGSLGGTHLNAPIVGTASTSTGKGYWLVASDGGVFSFGDAGYFGSEGGKHLNSPIVGMAATPSGNGYWLVAADGGVFGFGDAGFDGSQGGTHLNSPIVGMAATPSGNGYWLVASDGGVFAFGDAGFDGSEGGGHLNRPVVGMAATASGHGYWLVGSDGGVFAFGDAGYLGSEGGARLNKPIVGMSANADGKGYWLVASDGGVFSFGDAGFFGSEGGTKLNSPVVGMAAAG
jgi:hypothetical protein